MMQRTPATVWHRIIVALVLLHRMRTGRCCTVAVRTRIAVVVLGLVQLLLVRLVMLSGRPAVAQRSNVAVLRRTARRAVRLLVVVVVGASEAVRIRIGHSIPVMATVVLLLMHVMIVCRQAGVCIAGADMQLLLLMMTVMCGGVAVAEGCRTCRCTIDTVVLRIERTGQSCRHRGTILLLRMMMAAAMHETGATGGRCEAMLLLCTVECILDGTEIVATMLLVLLMVIITVAATQSAVRMMVAVAAHLSVQRLLTDDHTGHGGQAVGRVRVTVVVIAVTVAAAAVVDQEAGQRDRMSDGRVLMLVLHHRLMVRVANVRAASAAGTLHGRMMAAGRLLGVMVVVHLFVVLRLVVYDGHVNADMNAACRHNVGLAKNDKRLTLALYSVC